MKQFLLFLVLAVAFSACLDDPECINLVNNVVGITFKDIDGKARQMSFTSIQAEGASENLKGTATGSTFTLPIDYTRDTTKLRFNTASAGYDVALAYSVKSQFVSEDCGYRFVLSDLHAVTHPFDSLSIVSATPGVGTTAKNIDFFIR